MATNGKAIQIPNQPGGVADRLCLAAGPCHGVARAAEPNATGGPYFTDLRLRDEIPDDAAAERWFIKTFWPDDEGNIRCPRCAWNEPAKAAPASAGQPYRCPRCSKNFSIKTETVMSGSKLSPWEWVQFLHIWTGGIMPGSAGDLMRRTGVDEGTAHGVILRILKAAEQELPMLWEPAEMQTFTLGGDPKFRHKDKRGQSNRSAQSVIAIAMVGRMSGQTFIETIPSRESSEIQQFVEGHLVRRMDLYLSDTRANQAFSWGNAHFVPAPESTYLLFHLRERVRTWLSTVHNWVSPENMPAYLTGFQWWENHRHLGHLDRMRELARGMMWKEPPPSKTGRRRQKQGQKASANGGSQAQKPAASRDDLDDHSCYGVNPTASLTPGLAA